MKVSIQEHVLIVEKEPTDIIYPNTVHGQSRLLYHIKKELRKQGYDVIKKRMWKDGHLVDNLQSYIRTKDGNIKIWDTQWSIRWTTEPLNKDGRLELTVERINNI